MRQIVIPKYGDPDVLQIRESETPPPPTGHLQIRVHAAGINFADILARKGLYPDAPKAPCVVGYEVAGVVQAVGTDRDDSWIGQPVLALTQFGGYSDVVNVPAAQVFEKPEVLSFEQAAGVPVVYLTAWQLLVAMGGLQAGETVLVHNAGGGVGLAALDIIKHIGGTAIGTASRHKHEFLRDRGYDHVIDYRTQDWFKEVMRITDNKGVELIIDPLGSAHWKQDYKALRHTGRLGMFGVSSLTESGGKVWNLLKFILSLPRFSPLSLMNHNRSVYGVNIGHLWHESEKVGSWFSSLLQGVNNGWLRPHVDRTFPFEAAAEAHRYIENRKNVGKVVLVV